MRQVFIGSFFCLVGGAIFMALEGPEEREICRQMQEEIKERLQESLFPRTLRPNDDALFRGNSMTHNE